MEFIIMLGLWIAGLFLSIAFLVNMVDDFYKMKAEDD